VAVRAPLDIIARHCSPGEALRIAKVYLLKSSYPILRPAVTPYLLLRPVDSLFPRRLRARLRIWRGVPADALDVL
jgi:hypothetical protein